VKQNCEYKQGFYVPTNKSKYVGKKNPFYRSAWESRVFFWCDNNKLTSLQGAPKKVGGYFNCNNNGTN
jgi:hypothetical protein